MKFFEFFSRVYSLLWYTLPLWLPVITGSVAWLLYLQYARKKFELKNPKILLEIRLPQEIVKSPLAMELVLTTLYITSRESTWVDRYISGQRRPDFSLELCSFGGRVHFFIRTEVGLKNLVEASIYAQYPGVEVTEAPDYTQGVVYDPTKNSVWGCEFIKTATDPMPIKTYIDYGMDKDPDEENKIDPMTPALEFLGSVKEDQQVWFQIMIRAHKKELTVRDKKTGKNKKVDWTYLAEKEKQKMLDSLKEKAESKDKNAPPPRRFTKGEDLIVAAMERNVAKLPFDVGMRAIYVTPKETFNKVYISGILGIVRQYNSNNLNGLKPVQHTSFDYPWEDFNEIRTDKKKKKMLRHYKLRNFFYIGGLKARKPFVMSTEELATIFHLPGAVAATPSFARIMSKKSEPPANLPL